jgi:pimeloyl-ACP methyl ester carboxylesterase
VNRTRIPDGIATFLLIVRISPQYRSDLGEPERYRADVPNAKVVILNAGHFALDTKADEIAELVREFMKTRL